MSIIRKWNNASLKKAALIFFRQIIFFQDISNQQLFIFIQSHIKQDFQGGFA